MAWTDACKIEAVAQIDKRKEKLGSVRPAIREFAEESGIPVNTLKRWYYPETDYKCTRNGTLRSSPLKEASTISNLYKMQFDSGRKKILFGLGETDGNRFFVMQEFLVGRKGKEGPTKNHFTISMDLIPQFQYILDQVEVLIQERCSEESGVVGSDPQESDEVEPPAIDDRGLAQNNEVDGTEVETEAPPAPADGAEATTVESELIQCVDCVHFAVKKGAPEENGACNSRSGSWDGKVFQPPQEPHPCPNFQREEHE